MALDGALSVFLMGCVGGMLSELLHWWGLRQSKKLPDYVASAFYWLVTICMIAAGGLLAWLYFGDNVDAIIALHVGISTPILLQKLVTTLPETEGARNTLVKPNPNLRDFFTW